MTKNQNEQLDQNGKLECMLGSHNLGHPENAVLQNVQIFFSEVGFIGVTLW